MDAWAARRDRLVTRPFVAAGDEGQVLRTHVRTMLVRRKSRPRRTTFTTRLGFSSVVIASNTSSARAAGDSVGSHHAWLPQRPLASAVGADSAAVTAARVAARRAVMPGTLPRA